MITLQEYLQGAAWPFDCNPEIPEVLESLSRRRMLSSFPHL